MDITHYMHTLGQQARQASRALARAETSKKNQALLAIATEIRAAAVTLKQQNALDLDAGRAKAWMRLYLIA